MSLFKHDGKNILGVLLLASTLLSAEWIPFTSGALEKGAEFDVLAQTPQMVIVGFTIDGIISEDVNTQGMIDPPGENFVFFSLPDGYHTGKIGKPRLPAIKKTVAVPYGAEIKIEMLNSEYHEVPLSTFGIEKKIMPTLAPVVKLPDEKPVFIIDEKLYTQDAMYPADIARIENEDYMRGHRLAVIEVIPIQYNPVKNTIRYYTHIELKLTFDGGDLMQTTQKVLQNYSPLYEDFINRRVLNSNLYEELLRGVLPLPIHYLIITHDSFQSSVNDLAHWLKQKGFKVKVANQDSISPWTTTAIDDYIEAQNPLPTYLLLVGDVNGGYMPAPTGSSSGKVTDLYYAETDGSGYLPDIFYGRLSVETPTHIATAVDKILKYEKANLPDIAYWFK
ncbi:MAG: hypothetical protein JSU64_00600, partial [candidate division WOR-3 bacterium]